MLVTIAAVVELPIYYLPSGQREYLWRCARLPMTNVWTLTQTTYLRTKAEGKPFLSLCC